MSPFSSSGLVISILQSQPVEMMRRGDDGKERVHNRRATVSLTPTGTERTVGQRYRTTSGSSRPTLVFGAPVEQAWLVVEGLVDGVDLARDRGENVGGSCIVRVEIPRESQRVCIGGRIRIMPISLPILPAKRQCDSRIPYWIYDPPVTHLSHSQQRRFGLRAKDAREISGRRYVRDGALRPISSPCASYHLTMLGDLSSDGWQLSIDDIPESLLGVVGDTDRADFLLVKCLRWTAHRVAEELYEHRDGVVACHVLHGRRTKPGDVDGRTCRATGCVTRTNRRKRIDRHPQSGKRVV